MQLNWIINKERTLILSEIKSAFLNQSEQIRSYNGNLKMLSNK